MKREGRVSNRSADMTYSRFPAVSRKHLDHNAREFAEFSNQKINNFNEEACDDRAQLLTIISYRS